jgi:hypothetical protein
VVGQNSIPLLGATAVAILAFASIGGMTNNTGEFCRADHQDIFKSKKGRC